MSGEDVTRARFAARAQYRASEAAQRRHSDLVAWQTSASKELTSLGSAEHLAERRDRLAAFLPQLEQDVNAAKQAMSDAEALNDLAALQLAQALTDAEPLWPAEDPLLPVALFPLRLEVRYAPVDAGVELWIRAYPDDVHVDAFQPGLTPREADAAMTYWRTVWDLDPAADATAAAWDRVLKTLGAARAAWAVESLRPPVPPGTAPLEFPQVPTAPEHATRAPGSLLLPERLVFSGYRQDALRWRVEGEPIPPDLPLGFDPAAVGAQAPDPAGDKVPWTGPSRWLIDFDEAVRVGMAVRVPLTGGDLAHDLVTAVGVRTSAGADEDAAKVADALRSHQYTRGLAFVPPGAPTNNTPRSRSSWSSRPVMRRPEEMAERRAAHDPDGPSDAARLARALGIDGRPVLALADGDASHEEPRRRAAQRLVTLTAAINGWGQAVSTEADETQEPTAWPLALREAQPLMDHALTWVTGRGPLPTVRFGNQPYGVLPVSATELWQGDDVPVLALVAVRSLLDLAAREPVGARIGAGPDQDAAFLDVLSRVPRSPTVSLTSFDIDPESTQPTVFGWIDAQLAARGVVPSDTPGRGIRTATEPSDALTALLAGDVFSAVAELVAKVRAAQDAPAGQEVDLNAEFDAFQARFGSVFPEGDAVSPSVFVQLVCGVGLFWGLLLRGGIAAKIRELRDAGQTEAADLWGELIAAMDDWSAQVELLRPATAEDLFRVDAHIAEATDLITHRVDAWATSFATRRLQSLRAENPTGLRVGAYGWLESLAPQAPGHRAAADGWVLAPSLHHAVTAAVLRSGWLAHRHREAFAVDLTAARIRRARTVLEAVAAGRPLEAVLGYQFERALHDRHLDHLVRRFRKRFPLARVPDATTPEGQREQQAVGAGQVVDGDLLLRGRALLAQSPADELFTGVSDEDRAAVLQFCADLEDTVDAVADLLTAEGVHQLVGGRLERAAESVDAIGRGEPPPTDPEVLRTPRRGTGVHNRFAVRLPAAPPPAQEDGWGPGGGLAALAPQAEACVRGLLGPANDRQFAVRVPGAPGQSSQVAIVGVAALGLSALEAVAQITEPIAACPAARRALAQVAAETGTPLELLDHVDSPDIDDLACLADQARGVLAAAAPLLPGHLTDEPTAGWDTADLTDLHTRVSVWTDGVDQALSTLRKTAAALAGGPSPTAAAAVDAAVSALSGLGVAAATAFSAPAPEAGADADRARAVADSALALAQATERLLPAAKPPPDEPDARASWYTDVLTAVRALVGDWFTLPLTWPAQHASDVLSDAQRPADATDDAVRDWTVGRHGVRPRLAAADDLLTAAEILAGATPAPTVVGQAPFRTGAAWIGRAPTTERRAATVVLRDASRGLNTAPDGTEHCAGLILDEWTETLPSPPGASGRPEEIAAAAFHVDRPDARAPQAVLLAVPPDTARPWVLEDLHAIVEETFTLARVRTLDRLDLPELGRAVPW
ncbi:hypothetical protein [Streptomyces hilarionis]|uniref:hypothetical protein n=1 Tax=Streptomyces hilarionis TaxID=2839954 RepID=UPI002119CDB9|nr:hypothetical protein [Streptomyces hilarionis]MCQ9131154.1 hypothetical protein [Streptomyces hilarionis]